MTKFAEMNLLPESTIKERLKSMSLHDYMFEKFSLKFPDHNLKLSHLYKFVFVRHPFERLVSAFHDKFITIQQLNLMKPFINFYLNQNGINKPNSKEWQHITKEWVNKNINVTFQNFVSFVLHENSLKEEISGPSWHWWPFSDVCKICDIGYNYIGQLESLQEDISCILEKFPEYKVFQGMKTNIKNKVNASGHHNKNMTMEYFSQLSKSTIIELYRMYKLDFSIGGYSYPLKYIDVGIPDQKSGNIEEEFFRQ